jgi:hypothetical protein
LGSHRSIAGRFVTMGTYKTYKVLAINIAFGLLYTDKTRWIKEKTALHFQEHSEVLSNQDCQHQKKLYALVPCCADE